MRDRGPQPHRAPRHDHLSLARREDGGRRRTLGQLHPNARRCGRMKSRHPQAAGPARCRPQVCDVDFVSRLQTRRQRSTSRLEWQVAAARVSCRRSSRATLGSGEASRNCGRCAQHAAARREARHHRTEPRVTQQPPTIAANEQPETRPSTTPVLVADASFGERLQRRPHSSTCDCGPARSRKVGPAAPRRRGCQNPQYLLLPLFLSRSSRVQPTTPVRRLRRKVHVLPWSPDI
jgi:hypothetical protein